MIRRLLRCTAGSSALEYALVAAIVSVAGIAVFLALGNHSRAQLDSVNQAYENAK